MNPSFDETKHTTNPIYLGASAIGMKYKNGVVIATDIKLNYHGFAGHFNIDDRVQQINPNTFIGVSGEYSDFQEVIRILKEIDLEDYLGSQRYLGPEEYTNYLSAIHYYRRNKMNPYWNHTLIGGINSNHQPVLFNIDQFGTLLKGNYSLTGFAQYFCHSIISIEYPSDYNSFSREDAIKLIEKCFTVLFCRDTSAGNKIRLGFMEEINGQILFDSKIINLESEWNYKGFREQANEKFYLTY